MCESESQLGQSERKSHMLCACVCTYMFVCEREREKEREQEKICFSNIFAIFPTVVPG